MNLTCNICNSKLISVKQTVTRADLTFPITNTSYKCSNQECQDAIEARVAETLLKKQERELLKQKKMAPKKEV